MSKKRMTRLLLGLLALVVLGFLAVRFVLTPAEFRAQANPIPECQANMFDKAALVFDAVLICGTNGVPAE